MVEMFYEELGVDLRSDEWKYAVEKAEVCENYDKQLCLDTLMNIANDLTVSRVLLDFARESILYVSALHTLNKSTSREENREFEETILFYHNVFESYREARTE